MGVEEVGGSKEALHLFLSCGENHIGYGILASARETPRARADFITEEGYNFCSYPSIFHLENKLYPCEQALFHHPIHDFFGSVVERALT
jgi:hypothetical protein